MRHQLRLRINDRNAPPNPTEWALRGVAAVLVLAGGVVHLKLWLDGYRDIDRVGPAFLLNAVASAGAAVALVVWRHPLSIVGALGVVNMTLIAFGMSRTTDAVLNFREVGWSPAPEAALSVAFELGAAAALVALLAGVGATRRERPS